MRQQVATEGLEALTLWDALSVIPGLGYAGGALKYAKTVRGFKYASLQFPTIAKRLASVGGKLADLAGRVRGSTAAQLGTRMHEALKSSSFGQLLYRMRDLTANSSWIRIRIDQPIASRGLGSRPDITIEFPRARFVIAIDMKPVPKRIFYEGGFSASYKYLFESTERSIRGRREGTLAIYRRRGFSTLYLYIPYPSFVK